MDRVQEDGERRDPFVEHPPQPIEQRKHERGSHQHAPKLAAHDPIKAQPVQNDQHDGIDVDVQIFEAASDVAPLERVGHVQIIVGVVTNGR